MNYEKEYKEFSKWWEELTDKNPNWKTLERLAAKDAWMEASKRAEVNGAETSHEKALHKHCVTKRFELDFNGQLKTLVEISDNDPNILAAMNGYGGSVDTNKCIVTKK